MGKYATILVCTRGGYYYAQGTTLEKVKGDRELDFFFVEESLKPGTKTKSLDFVKKVPETKGWPKLLSRGEALVCPFATSKLDEILKGFSLEANSSGATIVKETLQDCEREPNQGETGYCAISLENMVDFAVSQLKTHDLRMLTYTFLTKEEKVPKSRVYTVQPGAVELPSAEAVVCHLRSYPTAVFYCHTPIKTKVYTVPLVAEDGTRVMAGALCHTDTAWWNPHHAAMLVLGIKPGTPVCHFLSHGNFAFVSTAAS